MPEGWKYLAEWSVCSSAVGSPPAWEHVFWGGRGGKWRPERNEKGQDEPKQRPDKRALIDPVRARLSRQKAHSQDLRCHDVTARLPNRSAHDRIRPPVSMCPDSPTVPGPPRGRGKPWRQPVAEGPGTH
ncbi:hypothetical protein MTO96_009869 [Rhipicephalus appendiculatus]